MDIQAASQLAWAQLARIGVHDVASLHTLLCWVMIVLGVPTFLLLMAGITAPYGRYSRQGWGLFMNAKLAWLVSCRVVVLVLLSCCDSGDRRVTARFVCFGLDLTAIWCLALILGFCRRKKRQPQS